MYGTLGRLVSLLVALHSAGEISAFAFEEMVLRVDEGDAVLRRALTDFLTEGTVERLRARFLEVAADIEDGAAEDEEEDEVEKDDQ